jgi:hypothetical protein
MKHRFTPLALFIALPLSVPALAESAFVEYDADRQWAEVAKAHPGFAGYYLDEAGRTVLLVADMKHADGLKAVMAGASGVSTDVLVTREVTFDFAELYDYKRKMHGMLSEPGVVYVDLDEVNNRIVVGVDMKDQRGRVLSETEMTAAARGAASRYGVPDRVLALVQARPFVPLTTLNDRLRPAPGGMRITNSNGGFCTLGIVVQSGAINGFLTNSHCTNVQGGVENTLFYQPTISSANLIGTEVADPPYLAGGSCPVGRVCRNSDSALVQFTGNNMGLGQWGYMARPTCSNCGSLTISTQVSRFSMVYNSRDFAVGDTVQKVGRTTGWTQGPVTSTCVTANSVGNITFFCQHLAQMNAGPGDSGSAIIRGSLYERRKLTGLLWGGNGTEIAFSSRDAVESEVGVVDVWP